MLRVPERRAGVVRGEAGVREVATHLGQYRVKGSQTSFERFLCSLPRADTVDSTVDWVLAQPDNIEVNIYIICNYTHSLLLVSVYRIVSTSEGTTSTKCLVPEVPLCRYLFVCVYIPSPYTVY